MTGNAGARGKPFSLDFIYWAQVHLPTVWLAGA
jgi:hypothetical protein